MSARRSLHRAVAAQPPEGAPRRRRLLRALSGYRCGEGTRASSGREPGLRGPCGPESQRLEGSRLNRRNGPMRPYDPPRAVHTRRLPCIGTCRRQYLESWAYVRAHEARLSIIRRSSTAVRPHALSDRRMAAIDPSSYDIAEATARAFANSPNSRGGEFEDVWQRALTAATEAPPRPSRKSRRLRPAGPRPSQTARARRTDHSPRPRIGTEVREQRWLRSFPPVTKISGTTRSRQPRQHSVASRTAPRRRKPLPGAKHRATLKPRSQSVPAWSG